LILFIIIYKFHIKSYQLRNYFPQHNSNFSSNFEVFRLVQFCLSIVEDEGFMLSRIVKSNYQIALVNN